MKIKWSREESKERFPYPISPLGWSLLKAPAEVSLQALSEHLGVKKPRFELEGNFSVDAAKDFQRLESKEWMQKYGHLTDNWDVMAPLLCELPAELLAEKSPTNFRPEPKASSISIVPSPLSFGAAFNNGLTLFKELVIADEELRTHSSAQFPEIKKLFAHIATQSYWPKNLAPKDIDWRTNWPTAIEVKPISMP